MKITKYGQVWELWTVYQDMMQAYVLKKTKDIESTNDLVHDILLKMHKSCCSDIEIKNIRSWLFQIAYNTIIDHFNHQKKSKPAQEWISEQTEDDMYQEMSEFIVPLLKLLPEKYAIPLKLADLEGKKQKDIADQLQLSLTATKSQIQRGRKMLKAEIRSCFHIKECKTSGLIDFEVKENCVALQKFIHKKK